MRIEGWATACLEGGGGEGRGLTGEDTRHGCAGDEEGLGPVVVAHCGRLKLLFLKVLWIEESGRHVAAIQWRRIGDV